MMDDTKKTKRQLIAELASLRQRTAHLEASAHARGLAEAALREREARTRAILETAVDGIITIDAQGLIESFNPAAERLFGYAASEVLGQNVKMLMPSPYHTAHDTYLARYLSTGEQKIIGIGREVVAQRKDGTTFPVALAVSEVRLGDRCMFTGIVHDLTAHKRAEATIARLSSQHHLILEAAGEGIYGVDAQGNITFVNPKAASACGQEAAQMIGQPMHALLHHTKHDGTPFLWYECPVLASMQDGTTHRVTDDLFWRQDGTHFPVEYVSTPLREHGAVVGAVVVFKDVTEPQHMAREMRHAERLALVGQLASGLAHEIGTPLNVIAGNAELLRMQLREQGSPTNELDTIVTQAERITRLIERLLTFARAQERPAESLPLYVPLSHALRLLETRFRREAITVLVDVPAVLPPVWGVVDQIEEVFVNVLVNAWHAMRGGGSVTVQACATPDQQVRIVFQDSGQGMAATDLARACEPFYSTKGDQGTGLGLAICKQIIDSHGGTLRLDSTLGAGTTVTIDLPQADPEDEA